MLYLNIPSIPNPTGDVRGQLRTIDYIAEGAFTSLLAGEFVVPSTSGSFTGCAIVTYDCTTKTMEFLIIHDFPGADDGVLGLGKEDEQGTIISGFTTGTSPIFGSLRLNSEQIYALYTNQLFFQIYRENIPVVCIFLKNNIKNSFTYVYIAKRKYWY